MFVRAADLSYIVLTAREVHRLAVQSIAEIDAMRRQRVNEALNEVEDETCSHFLGLFFKVGWDSTDGESRSGLGLHTDNLTGCQYLSSPRGGLVPRFDKDGTHICNRQEP